MTLRVELEGRQAPMHGSQKYRMTTREGKTDSEMENKKEEKKQDAKELSPEALCGN